MAEVKSSVDTNRQKIADIVPLDGPLSMYIEPTRACNFKCFYCMHSTRGVAGGELEKMGFSENGRLTGKAGDASVFLTK